MGNLLDGIVRRMLETVCINHLGLDTPEIDMYIKAFNEELSNLSNTESLPDVRDAVAEYEFDKVMLNSRFPGLHGYPYKQIADSHKPKQKAREHADAIHTLYAPALITAEQKGREEVKQEVMEKLDYLSQTYSLYIPEIRIHELRQSLGGANETGGDHD